MSEPVFAFTVSLPRELAFLPPARHVVETLCGLKILSEQVGPDSVTFVVAGERVTVLRALMPETVMPINYGVSIEILSRGEIPPQPPVPASSWWLSLKLTNPRTRIYTARDLVKIYRSVGISHPPQVSVVARIASIAGTGYDVWAAPLAGSEWICVFDGSIADPPQPGFVLWVSGNDMRATP